MIWSTFSTPTRMEVDSLSACAGAARVARAAWVMASAAAADSATAGAAGAGATAAGAGAWACACAANCSAACANCSTGAAGACAPGAASRAMFSWSASTMKQQTASISSGVQVLSTQTVSVPLARSLART